MGRWRQTCALGLAAALVGCGGDDGGAEGDLIDLGGEPPGENCPAGGAVIRSGTDSDGDGVLDDDEVSASRYVCSEEGQAVLVRLDDVPGGATCPGGGIAIHTGTDADGDGLLDDDEITTTDYVCGAEVADNPEVWEGDLLISNQIDAAQLVGVRVVTGELFVDAPGLATIDLSTLEEVEERFVVASLQVFDAPLLVRVGGDLFIGGDAVEQVVLPALAEVGGGLSLQAPWLEVLDLAGLELVGERLEVRSALITDLDLSSLTETGTMPQLGQGLFVSDMSELTGLAAPALASTAVLRVEDNLSLLSIDLASLSAAEVVAIRNNARLPTCRATAIAAQSGADTVTIAGNDDDGVCP